MLQFCQPLWASCFAILTLAAIGSPTASSAQNIEPWEVLGKLLGKPDGPSDFKKSKDVSGIACDRTTGFPRLCLVVDDEAQGAQVIILNDGKLVAGDYIKLIEAQFEGEPLELDAEGVAYESGSFYVAGSHGRPRHTDDPAKNAKGNAKASATRQIFRISLDTSQVDLQNGKLKAQPSIKQSTDLANLLKAMPELSAFYDNALEDNGLTIEGIAVQAGTLFVGLRGPVLGAGASVISVPLSAIFEGQNGTPKLLKLPLDRDSLGNPRGIRDLTRHKDVFLLIAGPVNDPPDDRLIEQGDYSIYSWDGATGLKRLLDLPAFGVKTKPEALSVLDADAAQLRALIMFDGPQEGAPRPISLQLK